MEFLFVCEKSLYKVKGMKCTEGANRLFLIYIKPTLCRPAQTQVKLKNELPIRYGYFL